MSKRDPSDNDGLVAGTAIGPRYCLVERLGAGGMASVWRASDLHLGSHVALKLLPPAFARNEKLVARFEREARTMARLAHPNVVVVNDFGQAQDRYFIAMELLGGGTLYSRLAAGSLSAHGATRVLCQVLGGLSHAHQHGVVHRDVKPGNILLSEHGVAKLGDFGIAHIGDGPQLTRTGAEMGTAAFSAPEQRKNARGVSDRADVYGAAATLVSVLIRSLPRDLDVAPVRDLILKEVPEPLVAPLKAALARAPEARPDARTFRLALEAALPALPPLKADERAWFDGTSPEVPAAAPIPAWIPAASTLPDTLWERGSAKPGGGRP